MFVCLFVLFVFVCISLLFFINEATRTKETAKEKYKEKSPLQGFAVFFKKGEARVKSACNGRGRGQGTPRREPLCVESKQQKGSVGEGCVCVWCILWGKVQRRETCTSSERGHRGPALSILCGATLAWSPCKNGLKQRSSTISATPALCTCLHRRRRPYCPGAQERHVGVRLGHGAGAKGGRRHLCVYQCVCDTTKVVCKAQVFCGAAAQRGDRLCAEAGVMGVRVRGERSWQDPCAVARGTCVCVGVRVCVV